MATNDNTTPRILKSSALILLILGALSALSSFIPWHGIIMSFFTSKLKLTDQNLYYLSQLFWPSLIYGFTCVLAGLLVWKAPKAGAKDLFAGISPAVLLFLISVWSLYLEVFLIRYLGQQVLIMAYFKNMVMISAFLGLGIGCLLLSRIGNLWLLHPVFLINILFLGYSPYGKLLASLKVPSAEHDVMSSVLLAQSPLQKGAFYIIFMMILVCIVAVFIPLGQAIASLMNRMTRVKGYLLNVLGSLIGILLMTLFSYLSFSPWLIFLIGIPFILMPAAPKKLVILGCLLLTAFGMWEFDRSSYWSPYYCVRVSSISSHAKDQEYSLLKYAWDQKPPVDPVCGYSISFNQVYGLDVYDMSAAYIKSHPEFKKTLWYKRGLLVQIPYKIARPHNALILGAGMGYDVSAALRNKVEKVTAVEIDPRILELGKTLNPEGSYNDPRVRLVVDDARSFVKKETQAGHHYDLVALTLLDATAILSGMSSNRLDSFVYTQESFREYRRLLDERGILTVHFGFTQPWIWSRLVKITQTVFPGQAIWSNGCNFLVVGPGLTKEVINKLKKEDTFFGSFGPITETVTNAPLLTDDWPFIYLRRAVIPTAYLWIMGALALLSFLVIRKVTDLSSLTASRHLHFAALGMGFLLMETKIITEVAVLFGSTWMVNSVAFSIVLAMVLLATTLQYRISSLGRPQVLFSILALALLFQYFVPISLFLDIPVGLRLALAVVYYGVPFFCASLIFAHSLSQVEVQSVALGSNLLGSVAGGFLEYFSLVVGIKALCVIALGLYLVAWLTSPKKQK